MRLLVLDDLIATSAASAAGPSPDEVPPLNPAPRLCVRPLVLRVRLTCLFRQLGGTVFTLLSLLLPQPHLPLVYGLIRLLRLSWEA